MEAQAGLGFGVIGDFSAAVEVDGRVGLARGEDLDAAGGQERAQPDAEGEREGFFHLAVAQVAAGVVAAVSGIEDDYEAGGRSAGWGRRLLGGYRRDRRDANEGQGRHKFSPAHRWPSR